FFGDKMSPLSDTTSLSSPIVEVDLFDHIKHVRLTTIPAFIISFILCVLFSPTGVLPDGSLVCYHNELPEGGLIHLLSWIPIFVLIGCTLFRAPAFISLTITSVIATICAIITSGLSLATIWSMWFQGYEATTTFEPVNELLTKGGINSMLFTISLVLLALG